MTLDQRDKMYLTALTTWLLNGAGRQRCPDDVYLAARVLADRLSDTSKVGELMAFLGPPVAISEGDRSCQE